MPIFTAIGTAVATSVLGAGMAATAGFTFLSKNTTRLIRAAKDTSNVRR